ncbi:MAG: preprotein translocase subunit SecA [Candidatus Pacebacteria bacterium]|nr:preprotein translocase subunit SecA [Candidatus Paceibacterota bacterium]MDD4994729.1 preprotein translocase subunit SecA [Candidatus Paceibacterota bacterium]MDD5535438.1 preprotein translocase subunit SecA [Candidatus Paceibacterota bacterium]
MSLLDIFFPDSSVRYQKQKSKIIAEINEKEKEVSGLAPEDFPKRIKSLKEQVQQGSSLDSILPEAFALTREASKRTLKQRHFDVQLLGGIALHEGRIIEMKTGEGKTLAATLPVALNAIEGKGVHVVTVNDYLARRDAVWMGQIYDYLGLTTGCLSQEGSYLYDHEHKLKESDKREELDEKRDEIGGFKVFQEFLRPVNKKDAYLADITYGTNSEFGFDYLRDHLVSSLEEKSQREHNFVIIDEADSVLIDEARTPLIISVPDQQAANLYKEFTQIVPKLKKGFDFTIDEKDKVVSLTEEGLNKVEKIFGFNIFDEKGLLYVHHLETALKANYLFSNNRDYIVKEGKVIIVDEFTGRMMPNRRYSGGLHQALEAKERLPIQRESRTVATITLQNYFRLYKKLAGMTGTAFTSAEEFKKVYDSEVIVVPSNKPLARKDLPDKIYGTQEAKLKAIAQEVKERNKEGQPILIGTPSVEKNELLGLYLKREGVSHNILNAKNHEKEGEIIAQAGKMNAVTVATNMAGRGVDIVLGGNPSSEEEREKVLELGGLYVIGTERHEARRIDNQLRGRSGRQGDVGSSQFFVSLEDDLMRIFAPKYLSGMMKKLGWPEDQAIEHQMVNKAIEVAQSKIEGFYFDMRKHILEYDDVINRQRIAFYRIRDGVLEKAEQNQLKDYLKEIFEEINEEFPEQEFKEKLKVLEEKKLLDMLKSITLRILDSLWIEHIEKMESLRDSTSLRAYGGKDSLVEYKKESYYFYRALEERFKSVLVNNVKNILLAEVKIEKR